MPSLSAIASLVEKIHSSKSAQEKKEILLSEIRVQELLKSPFFSKMWQLVRSKKRLDLEIVFLSLLAIGQGEHLLRSGDIALLAPLIEVEIFYAEMGGLVGYHAQILSLIGELQKEPKMAFEELLAPPAVSGSLEETQAGLRALPEVAEIYPLGGLGDRLNLKRQSGHPLPAALLPFLGRSLLELMVQDLVAREYLYFKCFGKQLTTPIAMMTSHEKQNAAYVRLLCTKKRWFHRPKNSFFLFSQISVPALTEEGLWSQKEGGALHLLPGGHGALWRMAEMRGVFDWLSKQARSLLLIRQINNPLAGLGSTLFDLLGYGKRKKKAFGLIGCDRLASAAEGVLALARSPSGDCSIRNIEYSDLDRFGVRSLLSGPQGDHFCANTNILFADLAKIKEVIKRHPVPACTFNSKSQVALMEPSGELVPKRGGRLESMMQNISDFLIAREPTSLETFVMRQKREHVMAAAKRSYVEGGPLLETPEGAHYALLRANHELLKTACKAIVPPFCSEESYLERGPSLLFHYHPALGPLREIVAQKLVGGRFEEDSELQLEIAELFMHECALSGSLLIRAENLVGHLEKEQLVYSERVGRCILRGVRIENRGINRGGKNLYWKNSLVRKEAFSLKLMGDAEFYAENVTFRGSWNIVVPAGMRWEAYMRPDGQIEFEKSQKEAPSWQWRMRIDREGILLEQEGSPAKTQTSSRA